GGAGTAHHRRGAAPSIADEQTRSTAKDQSGAPKAAARPTKQGAIILDAVEAELRCHVDLTDDAAATITLWVMHARAQDAAKISPLLAIVSPVRGCGKTTC